MSKYDAFLPETGRGTIRRMVEGHARVFPSAPANTVGNTCLYPSTSFAGPPPRAGEEL